MVGIVLADLEGWLLFPDRSHKHLVYAVTGNNIFSPKVIYSIEVVEFSAVHVRLERVEPVLVEWITNSVGLGFDCR